MHSRKGTSLSADEANVGINPNVSQIIIHSSLGFIANYHVLLTSTFKLGDG